MKVSKSSADYGLSTDSKEKCRNCEHFRGNSCTKVEGVIKPQYWCKYWAAMDKDEESKE